MNELQVNDYEVRVWGTKDRWVDIDLRGALGYARSDMGSGMQTLADEGSEEYRLVKELCDSVRDAVLALDKHIREFQGRDADEQ